MAVVHFGHSKGDSAVEAFGSITDDDGEFSFELTKAGQWYVGTIHMLESSEAGLDYESHWATLTFEVGHSHADGGHSHAEGHHHHGDEAHSHDGEGAHTHGDGAPHVHAEEGGIPGYLYWLASFVVLAGLFFWFNRKQ